MTSESAAGTRPARNPTGSLTLRLASGSPRRRLLLPLLGYPVEVRPTETDERVLPGEAPLQTALRLAEEKANAAGKVRDDEVVVGADTIVVLEGKQLGKPSDAQEAREMLTALRGRPHEVITGVALRAATRRYSGAVRTLVSMRPYAQAEAEAYVASGRPLDKAGSYAIQDRDFSPVERIEGCYLNVVGLPLCEVSRGLRTLGWPEPAETFTPPCRLCLLGKAALEKQES